MTLTIPPGALRITLEDTAERICGGFMSDHHKRVEVARLTNVLKAVTPDQYKILWRSIQGERQ